MEVMIKHVRIAFPVLHEPKPFSGGDKESYSALLILDHTEHAADLANLEKAIKALCKEKWGAKAGAMFKAMTAKGNLCLRDGADKAQYEGFDGNMYISTRAKVSDKPLVIDRNKQPLTEDSGKPYSGCYVNVKIVLWPQDNQYGQRINAQILGVQFDSDGEAFSGGGTASADDFEEMEAVDEGVDDLFGETEDDVAF